MVLRKGSESDPRFWIMRREKEAQAVPELNRERNWPSLGQSPWVGPRVKPKAEG